MGKSLNEVTTMNYLKSPPSYISKLLVLLIFLFPFNLFATILSGQVTSGSGTFIKLTPPFIDSNPDNTVGDDTFNNLNLYGFDEGQNILITSDLSVDITSDGMGGSAGPGTISMGTTVASHYVFFDPLSAASQVGTVTFDSEVLAIITSTNNLNASDVLINTGVTYLNPGLRGLEGGDSALITGFDEITVDWRASTPGDYVRVLTAFSPGAVVPIPAAIWLFGTALLALIWKGSKARQSVT